MAQENYETLQANFVKLNKDFDDTNQALYDCKRQLQTAQLLENEHLEEIRSLQQEKTGSDKKWEDKIQQLEETILNLKSSFTEKVGTLEQELSSKEEQVANLKRKLEELSKTSQNKSSSDENDNLIKELINLKQECEDSIKCYEDLKLLFEECRNENDLLKSNITKLEEDLKNINESFNCKKEELHEANNLIQTLQDDLAYQKIEIDAMKNKPLDNESQGNSLFAEVNDRRLQLQTNFNTMKSTYLEMKRERGSLLNQIAILQKENASLCARWREQTKDEEYDKEMIIDSYKAQIQTLQDLIESYKKDLNEKNITNEYHGMEFFTNMLDSKNQEIEQLRQKLQSRSLNLTISARELAELRQKLFSWEMQAKQFKSEVENLKTELEMEKMKKSDFSKLPDDLLIDNVTVRRSGRNSRRETIFDVVKSDDKENSNETKVESQTSKNVRFTASTVETNRNPVKMTRKIIISKPIHISTVQSKKS